MGRFRVCPIGDKKVIAGHDHDEITDWGQFLLVLTSLMTKLELLSASPAILVIVSFGISASYFAV